MDRVSQRLGSKTFRFLVHSAENQAIPASAIVLSNSCFASHENPSKRRYLLDPLQWHGCELAPTPSSTFLVGKPLNVLLRLYPRSPQISNDLLHLSSAHLVIDETDTEVTQVMPLSITNDDVAGVAVFGTVDLTALGTSAGSHKVKIVLSGPKDQKLIGETGFNLLSPISAEK